MSQNCEVCRRARQARGMNSNLRTNERLANLLQRQSPGFALQGRLSALKRFVHRFIAEAEGLMMHRYDVTRARGIGHRHGLLRGAMMAKVDEHGRMPQPANRDGVVRPGRKVRFDGRRPNAAPAVGHDPPKPTGGSPFRTGQPKPAQTGGRRRPQQKFSPIKLHADKVCRFAGVSSDGMGSRGYPSFHGLRKGRVKSLLASGSPTMTSVFGSHFIFRPTTIAIWPRCPGTAE
jgi:hypothetical protein